MRQDLHPQGRTVRLVIHIEVHSSAHRGTATHRGASAAGTTAGAAALAKTANLLVAELLFGQ